MQQPFLSISVLVCRIIFTIVIGCFFVFVMCYLVLYSYSFASTCILFLFNNSMSHYDLVHIAFHLFLNICSIYLLLLLFVGAAVTNI